MKIGSIQIDNPTIFAPLAGISNLPMRLLAKTQGCALVYSEMVSANGLVQGSTKTAQLLASVPRERPLSIQLFGSDPGTLAEAAKIVEAAGADILDINFGCAVKKILKGGSGVALMRDLPKAAALLEAVRAAVRIPLTIKIRSGWDASGQQALDLAHIAQESGLDAIAVHPRTARQAFSGLADWSLIGRIKARARIPIIGNGDVKTPQDAARMLATTGCDGVMVGRAAIGNPFIFSQIRDHLAGRELRPATLRERFCAMADYVTASVHCLGESRACLILRSRLGWFVKGLPLAGQFRQSLRDIDSASRAMTLLRIYEARISEAGPVVIEVSDA
jgi:tRNA-dihydrouridine synthase B